MAQSQAEARRYFADKVVRQARAEGLTLSDAEHRMLFWSESAPDSESDPELADRLALEMSDEEYETKIAGLLTRRLEDELGRDPGSKEAWTQARAVLGRGDHYILIMIDRAADLRPKAWWQFWR
jgi:hypothetical protein